MFMGLDISIEKAQNLFIAGDLFMQLYYCVFDRDKNRVGMAKALHTMPEIVVSITCLLYTSPSPRDRQKSRMPSSA